MSYVLDDWQNRWFIYIYSFILIEKNLEGFLIIPQDMQNDSPSHKDILIQTTLWTTKD